VTMTTSSGHETGHMIAGFVRAGYSHIEKAPAATGRDATPNTARRRSSPGSRLCAGPPRVPRFARLAKEEDS
ncbi:MAG: hypothetical protein OXK82_09800, partial [Deltaproteobacteria bacterium]|nr:hypothetical protein [Deltaproteobacteria bacterium]